MIVFFVLKEIWEWQGGVGSESSADRTGIVDSVSAQKWGRVVAFLISLQAGSNPAILFSVLFFKASQPFLVRDEACQHCFNVSAFCPWKCVAMAELQWIWCHDFEFETHKSSSFFPILFTSLGGEVEYPNACIPSYLQQTVLCAQPRHRQVLQLLFLWNYHCFHFGCTYSVWGLSLSTLMWRGGWGRGGGARLEVRCVWYVGAMLSVDVWRVTRDRDVCETEREGKASFE